MNIGDHPKECHLKSGQVFRHVNEDGRVRYYMLRALRPLPDAELSAARDAGKESAFDLVSIGNMAGHFFMSNGTCFHFKHKDFTYCGMFESVFMRTPESSHELRSISRISHSFPTVEVTVPNNLHTPGAKDDQGKPMASLLADFGPALLQIAEIATFGARKYTVRGWMSVPDAEQRYLDAAWRHLLQSGNDQESGLPHLAHAAWNLLAILTLRGKA
jgi:hypothetical protein